MMHSKLNVLVIDDDEDDIFLTCDYLSSIDTFNITIDKEVNYLKALNLVMENRHDIYLVDYLLGAYTGIELIRQCNKAGINKPFILLTGKGDRKIDIEATKVGAYDYLTKGDLNSEVLERSLRYSLQRYASLKAISESENKYRQLFTKSNDIIFVLDKNYNVIDFNPMMTALTQYGAEELTGKPVTGLFATQTEHDKFIGLLDDCGTKINSEIVLQSKNGERKTFLASCSGIVSPEGEQQYQVILYDYTSIKKSHAEQLIKEKIETTERLVRSLAHEIRNPLTSINLSLHQLEFEVGEDAKPLTDIIKRNSNRIHEMIGELMHLSNPVDMKEEEIQVTELVQSVMSLANDRIKLKGITTNEQYRTGEALVVGDRKKLEMALLNIVVNAIEAVDDANGMLSLETYVSGREAGIKISDNGPGIATENLSSLFQPYFTGKKNGIGLGLATTHTFIHAHNGSIEVDSEIGKGTAFTVKLQLQN